MFLLLLYGIIHSIPMANRFNSNISFSCLRTVPLKLNRLSRYFVYAQIHYHTHRLGVHKRTCYRNIALYLGIGWLIMIRTMYIHMPNQSILSDFCFSQKFFDLISTKNIFDEFLLAEKRMKNVIITFENIAQWSLIATKQNKITTTTTTAAGITWSLLVHVLFPFDNNSHHFQISNRSGVGCIQRYNKTKRRGLPPSIIKRFHLQEW